MAAPARALLSFLLLVTLACSPGGGATAQDPAAPAPRRATLAIRAAGDLAAGIREGSFFRWGIPRFPGLQVEVGPEASGDAVVWVEALPASPAVAGLVKGLPVGLGGGAIVLGGTRYPEPGQALALRIPGAEKPTWIVAGRPGEGLTRMADEVLFRVASAITGQRRGRRGAPLDVDYLLRETPWMERSGRWARAADGAWTLDRAAERDDLAEWDRAFGGMATLGSKQVRLLVPAAEKERPELIRLATQLDLAVGEMAPRVPVELSCIPHHRGGRAGLRRAGAPHGGDRRGGPRPAGRSPSRLQPGRSAGLPPRSGRRAARPRRASRQAAAGARPRRRPLALARLVR